MKSKYKFTAVKSFFGSYVSVFSTVVASSPTYACPNDFNWLPCPPALAKLSFSSSPGPLPVDFTGVPE